LPAGVHATAARNLDGKFAVVVFNDNTEPLVFEVVVDGATVASRIAPDSIQTLVMD
jgi:hypothetical protein